MYQVARIFKTDFGSSEESSAIYSRIIRNGFFESHIAVHLKDITAFNLFSYRGVINVKSLIVLKGKGLPQLASKSLHEKIYYDPKLSDTLSNVPHELFKKYATMIKDYVVPKFADIREVLNLAVNYAMKPGNLNDAYL